MRRRVQARLRKAIRAAEHRLPGFGAAVALREREGCPLDEALCRLAIDLEQKADRRRLAAGLAWKAGRSITPLAAAATTGAKAAYLGLFYRHDDRLGSAEMRLFAEVMAHGTNQEQFQAIDGVAFVDRTCVRRALMAISGDEARPLELRERATEMLHLQGGRETAEACVRALRDPQVSIRFWAAYTLGNMFGRAFLEMAVPALEAVLGDREVSPGWWSVGKEARASLVGLRDIPGEQEAFQAELRAILADPASPAEDRRWAECYRVT